jgi:hypothetical protein
LARWRAQIDATIQRGVAAAILGSVPLISRPILALCRQSSKPAIKPKVTATAGSLRQAVPSHSM